MLKLFKVLKFLILAIIVFLLQYGLINSLPSIWSRINLFPFLIIFLFIFYSLNDSLYFSVLLGFLLDIFSFYPFGIYIVCFLLVLFLADFFWNRFFTNRSIYSFLALSFFLLIFYNLILYSFIYYFDSAYLLSVYLTKSFLINLFWELFWILLGIAFSFYFIKSNKNFLS